MEHAGHNGHTRHPYAKLLLMALLSFVAMYALMYAMVDRFDNVYSNWNQAWMAGLMTAPMLLIELLLMRSMYPDRRLNVALMGLASFAALIFWYLIRTQAGIDEKQFLRSMIPHHAGAILMCEQRNAGDGREVRELCEGILASQRNEIARMEAMLAEESTGSGSASAP